MHEGLYPAMQGYDSYFLDTDIQIGGTDQTFNMQAGRTLQKNWRNKESFILATEFLMGTDGRKMSKSWGNAIWLDDNSYDMYAKILAVNDDLVDQYFTLGTNINFREIEKIKSGKNPMDLKKELAKIIITQLHGEKNALEAKENFETTIQKHEMPEDIPVYLQPKPAQDILNLLVDAGITKSKSEAKRLIEQEGVTIDGKVIKPNEQPSVRQNSIIKVGKRKFVKIKIK